MWINFWPLWAVCVAGVWGFLHVPFQRLQRRLDTIVQSIRFQLSPFWHKCLTQSERTKCPKHTLCTSCSLLKNLSQWLGQAGIRRSSHKILYYVMSPLLYQSYLVMVIWPCPSETQLIDHYWPRSPHPPQFCGGGVHLLTEMSHDRIVGFLQMKVMLFVLIAAVNLISNGKGKWYSYLKYSISHWCLKSKCAKHCILRIMLKLYTQQLWQL